MTGKSLPITWQTPKLTPEDLKGVTELVLSGGATSEALVHNLHYATAHGITISAPTEEASKAASVVLTGA